ncbi:hypothetical protein ACGF7U_31315 [Micromonospora sp. NPDC047670]|uniref:hypothetical protein n=1 Tax=Micromonospora sp. NPDC047670 TaxID=3364252 RepID=UPI00371541CC
MRIALDVDQVALLAAVDDGRVHMDPRFTRPDFEREPGDRPVPQYRRATQRLRPLKRADLVELDDGEPRQYGVRPYRLTALGRKVLAEARAQAEAAAVDDPAAAAPVSAPPPPA